MGNTRPTMIASAVTMVAALAGDYLLIEPRWGLPGFGVAGAAWASTLGSWLGFAVIGGMFARLPGARRPRAAALRWGELSRTLRFGLPHGLGAFFELAAFTLFGVALAGLGTTELAAFNVSVQINTLSFLPGFGLASAGGILVAEAIGRRAQDEVWPIVKLTAQVTCGWMGSVGLLLALGSEQLMSYFRPRDTALLEAGSTMLAFAALSQLLDALGYTFSDALRAAGDTAWCMAARFVLAWFVFTPFAFLAVQVFQGSVVAAMHALPFYVYSLALTATLAARFASGEWRNIDLLGPTPVRPEET